MFDFLTKILVVGQSPVSVNQMGEVDSIHAVRYSLGNPRRASSAYLFPPAVEFLEY